MHTTSLAHPLDGFDGPAKRPLTLDARARRDAARASGALRPAALTLAAFAVWAGLVGGRAQIVRIAPGVAPAYAALGLPVNLRHMEFAGVTSRLIEDEGRTILVVEGQIRNLADQARAMPRVKLAVLDEKGLEIYTWTAAPPKARLNGHDFANFRARLAAPPAEARNVRVKFSADPGS